MSKKFDPNSVKAFRKSLNLSQNNFAKVLGCTPESIRNWENGRSTPAGYYLDFFHRICRKAGVSPPDFYGPQEDVSKYIVLPRKSDIGDRFSSNRKRRTGSSRRNSHISLK